MGIILQFIKDTVIEKYYGSINLDELLRHLEEVGTNPNRGAYDKVIADMRSCTLSVTRDDLLHLAKELGRKTARFQYAPHKIAILTTEPKNAALIALLQTLLQRFIKSNIKNLTECKLFSTEAAASAWLHRTHHIRSK